jgi:hypothetical protein
MRTRRHQDAWRGEWPLPATAATTGRTLSLLSVGEQLPLDGSNVRYYRLPPNCRLLQELYNGAPRGVIAAGETKLSAAPHWNKETLCTLVCVGG